MALAEQDPAAWDSQLIEEAEALLSRASALPGPAAISWKRRCSRRMGFAGSTGRSDWEAIERIYDALLAITGSPVVAINRAIAVAETRGAAAGLAALDTLSDDPRLAEISPTGPLAPDCSRGRVRSKPPMPRTSGR